MEIDLATFLIAALLIAFTPGPSVLYVAAFSLRFGTGAGLVSALGINSGSYVLIAIAAFGLYPLLQTLPGVIETIRVVGGLYMLYLAHGLWPRGPIAERRVPETIDYRRTFTRGFLTTVTNPKDILFYLLFIPTFIHGAENDRTFMIAFVALAVGYALIGLVTKSAIALFAGTVRGWLARGDAHRLGYGSSMLLAGVGLYILGKGLVPIL